MKKKQVIILILIFIAFVIGITMIIKKDDKQIIVKIHYNDKILEEYNNNLSKIKENLDYATISNEDNTINWYKFKYQNLSETELYVINLLIKDVRNYYTKLIVYNYDYDYISKFKNITKMPKKEFDEKILGYNSSNELVFTYEDFFLQGGSYEFMNLKYLIDSLNAFYQSIEKQEIKDYKELLIIERNKSKLYKNITEYLRNYYDYLKKKN